MQECVKKCIEKCVRLYRKPGAKNVSKKCGTTYPKKHCERPERMFQNGAKMISQKAAEMVSKKTPKQFKKGTEIVSQKSHETGFL